MQDRPRSRPRLTTLVIVALAACRPAGSPPDDAQVFDFLEGSWTTLVDGFSVSLDVRRDTAGTGWIATRMLDDGNHVIETATLSWDPASDRWTRRWSSGGEERVFRGGRTSDGVILLVPEGEPASGEDLTPLAYRPYDEGDAFVLETASRDGSGRRTTITFAPGVYDRVDRPASPPGPGRIAFISNRSGDWDVYTMTPDGEDVRNVTRNPAGDAFPHWVAGGRRLSFRSQRKREDGDWDRWEVDVDGTDLVMVDLAIRLSNPEAGEFPQLHPSGAYIVNAAEREGEQDLYVWSIDGRTERAVAPAPGLDYRPLFSPDGSRVLFISERDGNAELYTVAFDGSDLRRLTDSPGMDRYAQWSPDGSRIAFVSDRDGDLELFVMNADGTDVRQLTRNEGRDGEISWSPDGRRLAYRSDVAGEGDIHVLEVATGAIVNVTRHEAYDGEPVWSPSGGFEE